MIVQLCNTTEPNEKLIKELIDIVNVDATPYGQIDIEAPTMLIATVSGLYNYCYIPDYGKYYYVSEPTRAQNGMSYYKMEVDPLMSNASDILNLDVTVERQQSNFNEYINDGTFVADTREFIQCVNFSNGFNDTGELILVTAGGVATI